MKAKASRLEALKLVEGPVKLPRKVRFVALHLRQGRLIWQAGAVTRTLLEERFLE